LEDRVWDVSAVHDLLFEQQISARADIRPYARNGPLNKQGWPISDVLVLGSG
jgi:hypothetical protein